MAELVQIESKQTIRRSLAGGDPRGAVSLVLDAVRPPRALHPAGDPTALAAALAAAAARLAAAPAGHSHAALYLAAARAHRHTADGGVGAGPAAAAAWSDLGARLRDKRQLVAARRAFENALLADGADSKAASTTLLHLGVVLDELAYSSSLETKTNMCEAWSIASPLPGAVFPAAAAAAVRVRADLARLDPRAAARRLGLGPHEVVGFVACAHFQHFQLANCFGDAVAAPSPGRKLLEVRVYTLPHFIPLDCDSDTVEICVGSDCHPTGEILAGETSTMSTTDDDDANDHSDFIAEKGQGQEISFQEKGEVAPLCAITIVLNGMPFIQHHITSLSEFGQKLKEWTNSNLSEEHFWHWHIVEGVATGRADHRVPYSNASLDDFHSSYLSMDGTTDYIDSLAQDNINVHVHRKFCHGLLCPWRDKLEMMNTALQALDGPCTLLQLDSDELWTADMMFKAYHLLNKPTNNDKDCAYFHCHFFVAEDLVTVTPGGYGHFNYYEWLRMWKYEPGRIFYSHAPPSLIRYSNNTWESLIQERCISHNETLEEHIVFSHYAYTLDSQVQLKSVYYGHSSDFVEKWMEMASTEPPFLAEHFLPWIKGDPRFSGTLVDRPAAAPPAVGGGVPPVPPPPPPSKAPPAAADALPPPPLGPLRPPGRGRQGLGSPLAERSRSICTGLHIGIDAVTFQMQYGNLKGISRVWMEVIPELLRRLSGDPTDPLDSWGIGREMHCVTIFTRHYAGVPSTLQRAIWEAQAEQSIQQHLDISLVEVPMYNENDDHGSDSTMLTLLCNYHAVDVFFSTQYTSLDPTFSYAKQVLVVHDLIPEIYAWETDKGFWDMKAKAIRQADAIVTVSNTTKTHLKEYYPEIKAPIYGSSNGLNLTVFKRASPEQIHNFTRTYGIPQPYILLVGSRFGYKNGMLLYEVMQQAAAGAGAGAGGGLFLLLAGGEDLAPAEARALAGVPHAHLRGLADAELAAAYSGATALAQLSAAEGFGLAVAEAMACGCPVVATDVPIFREITGRSNNYTHPNEEGCSPVKELGIFLLTPRMDELQVELWHILRHLLLVETHIVDQMAQNLRCIATRFQNWGVLAQSLLTAARRVAAAPAPPPG